MKKLKINDKHIFFALVSLFIGYIGLRYYIKPEWFDSEHIYHKVYNIKVAYKKSQKKTLQDIHIEFIHFGKNKSVDGQWKESTRTDIKTDGNWHYSILHLTFSDKTKLDILFDEYKTGYLFQSDNDNYKQFEKLSLRFPGIEQGDGRGFRSYLMMYQGDTIYQNIDNQYVVTSFQLKNPKTHKLQTYYEYGVAPKSNVFPPVYFLQDKKNSAKERQEFFDDYRPNDRINFWNRSLYNSDSIFNNRLNIEAEWYKSQLFYSERFENLPIYLRMTGNKFKTTITDTYVIDGQNDTKKGIRVQSRSKTYTEENKDQFVKEVLNQK